MSLININQTKLDEIKATNIRQQRDLLLKETDWMVLPDSSYDTQALRTYRQSLRDITSQETFPNEVVWPTLPAN